MTAPTFFHVRLNRRRLLQSLLLSTGGLITSDVFAEALTLTQRQTEGPYYPDHLPLDQDNDLVRIENGGAALGTVASFGGRLLLAGGQALPDATIELWQADENGCYIHSRGVQRGKERDPRFQGYGKIKTNAKGEYRFRTIIPGLYTGRTRHFHIAVVRNGQRLLTTQLYLAGDPANDRDGILNGIKDPAKKLSVMAEFKPAGSGSPDLAAAWNIVVGETPEDAEPRRRPGGPPPPPRS